MRRNVVLLVGTLVLILAAFFATLASSLRPLLGLDLQGGISVVLFPVQGSDTSTLDTAVNIIRNRVDALGVVEPEVSRQGDTIVIDLPGAENRSQALELIGQTAQLRFRPVLGVLPRAGSDLANSTTTGPGATSTTVPGATTTAPGAATTTAPTASTSAGSDTTSLGVPGRTVATTPIVASRPAQETATTTAPGATTTAPVATTAPGAPTTTVPADAAPQLCTDDLITTRAQNTEDATVILPDRTGDLCYQLGPAEMTGDGVGTAKAEFVNGQWEVRLDLTGAGSSQFDAIAQKYFQRQIAIELDGVVQSAPTINAQQFNGTAVISGSFTSGEAKDLALVLRYGALPVQFDDTEQTVQSISPTLGSDQLSAGILAGAVGLGLVALYMLVFYRVLGLVVWAGIGLTGMVFFALVSYLGDSAGLTLTLAGVTGLIVSVGVTVDSYVVYFERLKDEVRTGKTVRSSVDTGFRRSFRTIVAADLVSLLGAVILWTLATGSVRGFAFFLGLSTVLDLVISYTFMHPLVSIMARRPGLVRMRVLGIAAGLDASEAEA